MAYYELVLLKFLIGFLVVIAHLNISGKTQLSQMTPIDFFGNFVLGGIIGGVIYDESIPMHQFIIVLLIGVCLISLLNAISKHFHFFRSVTIGRPIPIIKNGKFLVKNVLEKKNKIDILNIASQLHSKGIPSFQEILYAQIEPDGQMTVATEESELPSAIIMKDGEVRSFELDEIDKSEEWLNKKIEENHLKIEDIFIVEYWRGNLTFIMTSGEIKNCQ